MPSVTEALVQASQLEAALRGGLDAIDRNQQICFVQYTRKVLPADGYIFWVRNGQTIQVPGSLHYAVDVKQDEDQTVAVNRVEFTSEREVQQFNAIAPNVLWIGSLGDAAASAGPVAGPPLGLTASPVLFAFSSRGFFYRRADVYHYVGVAVQPAMLSQIITVASDIPASPIVTNSLPIWLGMPGWISTFAPSGSTLGSISVYPSFVVPANVEPPYIVAHIPPESTVALQAFPAWDQAIAVNKSPPPAYTYGTIEPDSGASPLYDQPASQLMKERVRLTFYGLNNASAMQYVSGLLQYCINTDGASFGILNMPAISDEKRTQPEIMTIAEKKCLELEISYYQSTAAAIARRLILSATASITLQAA